MKRRSLIRTDIEIKKQLKLLKENQSKILSPVNFIKKDIDEQLIRLNKEFMRKE